ncbi:hypothetical protein K0M31_010165 [Melipona bicolor]|uniref:Uncharacterized protein n=1 Tax=Melipona bicolor TaxID=60889 RepID=A0AA40KIQ7_9HYME|nr:hypothetical protein K0M31_010165 [Melipona bicolor]
MNSGLSKWKASRFKLLLEVYATPSHQSRDPSQPIANFRCISVAPEEARFSGLPPLKSLSVIKYSHVDLDEMAELFERAKQPEAARNETTSATNARPFPSGHTSRGKQCNEQKMAFEPKKRIAYEA